MYPLCGNFRNPKPYKTRSTFLSKSYTMVFITTDIYLFEQLTKRYDVDFNSVNIRSGTRSNGITVVKTDYCVPLGPGAFYYFVKLLTASAYLVFRNDSGKFNSHSECHKSNLYRSTSDHHSRVQRDSRHLKETNSSKNI